MPSSHSSGCIISFIQEDVSENSCPYYAKYGVFSLLQLHIRDSLPVLSSHCEEGMFLSSETKKIGHWTDGERHIAYPIIK